MCVDLEHFWGHITEYTPVHWGRLGNWGQKCRPQLFYLSRRVQHAPKCISALKSLLTPKLFKTRFLCVYGPRPPFPHVQIRVIPLMEVCELHLGHMMHLDQSLHYLEKTRKLLILNRRKCRLTWQHCSSDTGKNLNTQPDLKKKKLK